MESATESKPPFKVRVKRWCKRLPEELEKAFAMQTPPGERSNNFV